MKIEQFVAQSEGQWRSMRSGHSLAFRHFENIISKVTIKLLKENDPIVLALLKSIKNIEGEHIAPFDISWQVEDDWIQESDLESKSGSSILIPIPTTNNSGYLFRSLGYTEAIKALSTYRFFSDGTLVITTKYNNTIAEERIWFLSKLVRCRSSVVYTSQRTGILQTSFASEIKQVRRLDSEV